MNYWEDNVSGRGAERVLQIIEWMAEKPAPVSFSETVRTLDLPKSSTLDLLRLLVATGYIERLADGSYRLVRLPGEPTPEQRRWGTLLRHADDPLRRAVEASRESGFIAVLEADLGIKYIAKILPDREILYDRDITIARRPHQVSSGVILLGRFTEAELRAYAEAERAAGRLTEPTGDLMARVARARVEGVHVNLTGIVEGASGMASPIFGRDGRIVAAANISGPAGRVESQLGKIQPVLLACAAEISKSLGWDGLPAAGATEEAEKAVHSR